MRAVLDTNVIVSAFINTNSIPSAVVQHGHAGVFEIVVSSVLLAEYRRVLGYPHIRRVHGLDVHGIERAISQLNVVEVLVDPNVHQKVVAADPDDDIFIACAVAGEADYIVSGDRHLLDIGEHRGIRILRPAIFLALLDSEAR